MKIENEKYLFRVKDLKGEIWSVINEAPMYRTSNKGRVKSVAYERFYIDKNGNGRLRFFPETLLKQYILNGYKYVAIRANGKTLKMRVNRLVAKAFIPNPNNYEHAHHKDGNRLNNFVENLEWRTCKENNNDKIRNERISKKMKGKRLNTRKVICNGVIYETVTDCAEFLKVPRPTINNYLTGRVKMPEKYKQIGLAYFN